MLRKKNRKRNSGVRWFITGNNESLLGTTRCGQAFYCHEVVIPLSGSTAYGTRVLACSPSTASLSVTSRPSRDTLPLRSLFRGTPTTTTLRRGAPPTRWARFSPRRRDPLLAFV